MQKTNLTPEDKLKLIDALNNDIEPPPDLLPKLFPRTAEKFDVKALDRAKIPTLEYAGKRSRATILSEAVAGTGAAPLQIVRSFGEQKDKEWKNLIVQGDNLQFLKTCYKNVDPLIKDKVKGKVKLIYIDPPFGTGDEYGGNSGEISYSAKIAGSEFIEGIRERLVYLRELLDDDGCIIIRLDYHFGHYVKVVADEIFNNNFKNELVVNRIYKNVFGDSKFIPTSTDSLFVYSKKENFIYKNVKKEMLEKREAFWRHMDDSAGVRHPMERYVFGKIIYPPPNKHFKYNQKAIEKMLFEHRIRFKCACGYTHFDPAQQWIGCPDCGKDEPKLQYLVKEKTFENIQSNWTDIPGYSFSTGYPTENSEILLERIISIASLEQDLVMDVFAGSGTTAAVAEKLGRRWIVCDFGKHSIYTIQKRMLRIGESKALVDEHDSSGKTIVKKDTPYKKPLKPFSIISSGAYDFSHVMDLRKHKETYVDFVLGLFQLSRDEEKTQKYKLSNIYALKDGDPVEVYPVWDDQFLKEVKIDEEYLNGIIMQSGGRLRGDYYIITPESCTNVGDITLKNQEGKNVNFHMLTFPYKVLEDISRNLELQEQPSSQDNVNNLITSTAFYFNEDVLLKVKRIQGGLQITKFETRIFNREGKRFEGFSGLAMLLIDLDYMPGKPFEIDLTIFAKDVDDNGIIKIDKLTENVGLIAIDKHGNESKPVKVE